MKNLEICRSEPYRMDFRILSHPSCTLVKPDFTNIFWRVSNTRTLPYTHGIKLNFSFVNPSKKVQWQELEAGLGVLGIFEHWYITQNFTMSNSSYRIQARSRVFDSVRLQNPVEVETQIFTNLKELWDSLKIFRGLPWNKWINRCFSWAVKFSFAIKTTNLKITHMVSRDVSNKMYIRSEILTSIMKNLARRIWRNICPESLIGTLGIDVKHHDHCNIFNDVLWKNKIG